MNLQLFAIKLKNDFFWKTFFHPRQLTTPTPTTQNLYPRPTAFSYTRPVLCLTVQLIKPWTPEIFKECYCDARNKPMRCEITKPQTALVICLWFWGLLAYPELYCDWPEHDQHSWKFSGVHVLTYLHQLSRHIKFCKQNTAMLIVLREI